MCTCENLKTDVRLSFSKLTTALTVSLQKVLLSKRFPTQRNLTRKNFFDMNKKGNKNQQLWSPLWKNLWFGDENRHKEHIGETEPGFLGSPLDLLHILYQPSGDKSGELTIENISLFKIESLIEGEAWSWTPVGCGTKAWWLGNQVEQFKHQTIIANYNRNSHVRVFHSLGGWVLLDLLPKRWNPQTWLVPS